MSPPTKQISVSIKLDAEMLADLDAIAKKCGVTRSTYLKLWLAQIRLIHPTQGLDAVTSIAAHFQPFTAKK